MSSIRKSKKTQKFATRAGAGGLFEGLPANLDWVKSARAKGSRTKQRRKLTKAQKKVNASKRAKQKRIATALKKFLHAQNPAVKYDGAAIVKLKGGAVRITPIKAKRGTR